MKQGRGRSYPSAGGLAAELDYLEELHRRAANLIDDLPADVLTVVLHDHSMQELMEHMVQGELNWVSEVADMPRPPQVASLDELDRFTRASLSGFSLDSATSAGRFTAVGQVLRHLQWHWTYHAGQIGMLRKALGYPYKWTFA